MPKFWAQTPSAKTLSLAMHVMIFNISLSLKLFLFNYSIIKGMRILLHGILFFFFLKKKITRTGA
jgi:hypothetical protein